MDTESSVMQAQPGDGLAIFSFSFVSYLLSFRLTLLSLLPDSSGSV